MEEISIQFLKEILVKLKNGSAPHRLNKGILEDMN
jgi:hypothetical protein